MAKRRSARPAHSARASRSARATERKGAVEAPLQRRTHEALQALLAMAEALVEEPGGADSRASAQAVANRLGVLTCEVLGCRSVGIITMQADGSLRPLDCVGLAPAQVGLWRERVLNWPYTTDLFRAIVARLGAGELVLFDTTLPENRPMANPFDIQRYLLAPLRAGTILVGLLSLNYGANLRTERPGDAALIRAIARLAALVIERERLQQEREEARARALAVEEANRRMDTFLGIAGHEMRTPLTTAIGNVELAHHRLRLAGSGGGTAGERGRDLASLDRCLDRTRDSLQRLNHLVGDLLDVSRIQAGYLAVRLAPIDLAALVREAVHEHRDQVPHREIVLQNAADQPVLVHGDAERLAQVMSNYLSNALKYSPPDRHIAVGLETEASVARVWVRDEGPGVPPAEQERIWDRFYRVAGTAPEYGSSIGLGLGLHICRSIIEQHQGQVGLESRPSAGARFWFTVPLVPPA